MTPEEILTHLRQPQPLPKAALRACPEQADAVVPLIAEVLERAADPDRGVDRDEESIVFFGVFVLGETGDTRAYRALLTFLGGDADKVGWLLGDALTETLSPILIRVAEDPAPLLALVTNPTANEYARGAALQAWARRAAETAVPVSDVRDSLLAVYKGVQPEREPFLAAEWAIVAAFFGLADLRPQAEQALAVQPGGLLAVYSMRAFDRDVERQAVLGSQALMDKMGWVAFAGTAVDELSRWAAFRDDPGPGMGPSGGGRRNPNRNVGRNDPCPCGSGKKAKKCCGAG